MVLLLTAMVICFMYPGDPLDPNSWSEISSGNEPGDRRGISATGPYQFNPGDTVQIDLAFVFARDYAGNNLTSVSLLKQRIQELINYYQNDSTPCGHSCVGSQRVQIIRNGHILISKSCARKPWSLKQTFKIKRGIIQFIRVWARKFKKEIITKEKSAHSSFRFNRWVLYFASFFRQQKLFKQVYQRLNPDF